MANKRGSWDSAPQVGPRRARLVLAQFWTAQKEDAGLGFLDTLAVASRVGVTAHGGPYRSFAVCPIWKPSPGRQLCPRLQQVKTGSGRCLFLYILFLNTFCSITSNGARSIGLVMFLGRLWMAQLDAVLHALSLGKSVRREEWEPHVRMFVSDEILMCQCGNAQPWQHALTWGEITAQDWQLFQTEPAAPQSQQTPAALGSDRALRNSLSDAGVPRNSFLLRIFPNRRGI